MVGAPAEEGPIIAGRYRALHVLGNGGMGEVLAAEDIETGERVAIKLLFGTVQGAALDKRLLRELLAAAQTRHPNLVPVVDFGVVRESGRPFFVMEHLEGEDLAALLRRAGHCAPGWIIPLLCDALDGLAAVHDTGIVHKDLKPANLFVDRQRGGERLRVTDFGIAHHMQRTRITQAGGLACTPKYAPPEYLVGNGASPKGDIYQMGLVLAEALFGWSMVADGPFSHMAFAHVNGELRLPMGLAGSPVGQVLNRALALDPHDRYATGREFSASLRELDLDIATATVELNRSLYRKSLR